LDKDSADFQHARSPENSLYVTPGADDDRTYLLSWKRLSGEKEVGVLEVLNFRKISREYAVNAEQGGDYTLTFTAAPGVYHAGARAAPDTRSERAPAIHPFRRQGFRQIVAAMEFVQSKCPPLARRLTNVDYQAASHWHGHSLKVSNLHSAAVLKTNVAVKMTSERP
jgi:hypothetical protein